MNSGGRKLSDGWMLCQSKSNPGRKYYFNKKTGKSSWTEPKAESSNNARKKKCKEKANKQNPTKKDTNKGNLKRKSYDGREDSVNKKSKSDLSQSTPSVVKKKSPIKPTPTKNLASSRLSKLRAELGTEVSNDSVANINKKQKIETQTKPPTSEVKSPNLNESKCSSSQSPIDSYQSTSPSPSQFLTANKIISSMKAQLPEKYFNEVKLKDTYADIEEVINNQTLDYISTKHPTTPPQFSEANKLVSAIKTKLSYTPTKDNDIETFTSAKNRMEVMRARLSSDLETSTCSNISYNTSVNSVNFSVHSPDDSMEIEENREVTHNSSNLSISSQNIRNNTKENVVLVVDTNVFIHELDCIKNVLNSHIKGYCEQPTLLVPWRVINELDRLKDNNNGSGALSKRARAAMDYLYKSLPQNTKIKGQSLRDASSHIYPCEVPDDEILNCCLQQAERGKSVILLSKDKNLCNKALINNIKCLEVAELMSCLEHRPKTPMDPELGASFTHYQDSMYQLLANILENEMQAKYNNLWHHVVYRPPPWQLTDVVRCLLKHWLAVFSDVFPRIENVITDLETCLINITSKELKSITESEVKNFKELCLEVARKCQIIPEYMELAKLTVERLTRSPMTTPETEKDSDKIVIEAFEGLWTVFSSYCAKLSTGLGLAHDLEDKLTTEDTLQVLTTKWPVFRGQIGDLATSIGGLLPTDSTASTSDDKIARLFTVFRESLTLINMESSSVNSGDLKRFCFKSREMLQEAHMKFRQLSELLDICKQRIT